MRPQLDAQVADAAAEECEVSEDLVESQWQADCEDVANDQQCLVEPYRPINDDLEF